jgi:hypothetical protein
MFCLYVAGRVRVVRALYKYTAQYVSAVTLLEHDEAASLHLFNLFHSCISMLQPDELSFQEGDLLYVFDEVTDPNWWKARCGNQTGLIPSNYGMVWYGMNNVAGPKFVTQIFSVPYGNEIRNMIKIQDYTSGETVTV